MKGFEKVPKYQDWASMKISGSTQIPQLGKVCSKVDTYHKPIWVSTCRALHTWSLKPACFGCTAGGKKHVLMNPVINDVGEGKMMNLAILLYI